MFRQKQSRANIYEGKTITSLKETPPFCKFFIFFSILGVPTLEKKVSLSTCKKDVKFLNTYFILILFSCNFKKHSTFKWAGSAKIERKISPLTPPLPSPCCPDFSVFPSFFFFWEFYCNRHKTTVMPLFSGILTSSREKDIFFL